MAQFTHLHVASCLSAHHGTAWPEALVDAQSDGTAAALTDRDGLYGAVRHIRACLDHGLAPIVGVDLLADGNPVTVLAHGNTHGMGWASLCRLISAAWTPKRRRKTASGSAHREAGVDQPTLRSMLLGEDGATGTVLLGPESDVGQAVLRGDKAQARALLRAWSRLLPGAVRIEIVCHYVRPGLAASLPHAAALLGLADHSGTPAVLTNAVRYLSAADVVAGDILDSAACLLPLGEFAAQPNAQAWLKPPATMTRIAAEVADAAGLDRQTAHRLLDSTTSLAEHCLLDVANDVGWRKPRVPGLDALGLSGDPQAILTEKCRVALPYRYPRPTQRQRRQLLNRLDAELATIAGFGFATYFLTVADITGMIRDMGVRVQARGSGAGSLVNHLLGISSVDPLEHDLLFERFLGGKRETLPDIDLDVESARRHDICRAIVARFGSDCVTLMASQNQYRGRGAIRDAGAALGMDESDIDQIAKSLWRLNANKLLDALATRPELVEVARAATRDPQIRRLFALAGLIDRLPRHVSMHPCGVIVSDQNLWSVTPTQRSSLGVAMSQYDKDDIDDMGLLKLDVLGVRMQSAIAHTLGEIERTTGRSPDLGQIATDDAATFEMICSTNTLGVFQIESPGQRELVGKMQPDSMRDLVADISLFRPGPVKANMIAPYVDAKLGFKAAPSLHPRFRDFLADGYGVVIYHEHVLRILADCMGITLGEADALRRRLSKDLAGVETQFRTATANRRDQGRPIFSPGQIDTIWTALASFGSFGFCKAHACAFAVTTYESAWLKTHYPTHFMAGLLEHDPGMYPRRLLIAEARRLAIPILGVDVNRSDAQYRVETVDRRISGIRVPFSQISGISQSQVHRLVAHQPYSSIADVIRDARPARPILKKLAVIGAFDSLAPRRNRGDIIAHTRHLAAVAKAHEPNPDQDQLDFTVADTITAGGADLTIAEKVTAELDVLHADITAHLLDPWRNLLDELGVVPADQLVHQRNNATVLVAGIRVASGTPPTKTGQRVAFISLDDGTGVADIAFFDDAQQQTGPQLFRAQLMLVEGVTRRTGPRGISVTAKRAWDLTTLAGRGDDT